MNSRASYRSLETLERGWMTVSHSGFTYLLPPSGHGLLHIGDGTEIGYLPQRFKIHVESE